MDMVRLWEGGFGIGVGDGLSLSEASLASRNARKRAVFASVAVDWATTCCFASDTGPSRREK